MIFRMRIPGGEDEVAVGVRGDEAARSTRVAVQEARDSRLDHI